MFFDHDGEKLRFYEKYISKHKAKRSIFDKSRTQENVKYHMNKLDFDET